MTALLDTRGGNTKLGKTIRGAPDWRVAGLSLMPDDVLCPYRNKAGCAAACLQSAGRGVMPSVIEGRQRKADLFHSDQAAFMAQLRDEIGRFERTCERQGVAPAVRLNVISDVRWELHGIPQSFPRVFFYDYTKQAHRLGKMPDNYGLVFSYSGAPAYQASVRKALTTDAPIAVVFRDGLPLRFLDRPVIDGDQSDLVNVTAGRVIVGLRAKGKAKDDGSGFVVDPVPPL